MNIYYISNSIIPSKSANSIQVIKMCEAFGKLGHKTTLLAPLIKLTNKEDDYNLHKHYGIDGEFKIKYIGSINRIQINYKVKIIIYLLFNRPEIVYTRDIYFSLIASLLRINTIIELHDPGYGYYRKIGYRILAYSKHILKVVLISKGLREIIIKQYYNKRFLNKIIIAHDGVDIKRFENIPNKKQLRKILKIDNNVVVIGYSGHLYKGRGIELILELTSLLKKQLFLIIGGNNEDIKYYIKKAEELNINNIKFLGFINNQELPKYIAVCDILLMPYQNKVKVSGGGNTVEFMSPLKMFEYMASNRPIISSDLKVIREVLNDDNSILCDPNKTNEWHKAINMLIKEKNLSHEFALNAFEKVKKYTWDKRIEFIMSNINI